LSDTTRIPPKRGGAQLIPRPDRVRPGAPAPWNQPGAPSPRTVTIADVRSALKRRGDPPVTPAEVPLVALPGPSRRPAAVLCALFDEDGQAQVVLTRRSSGLRSHTSQVSFPGGRLDPGEPALDAALREAWEEIGLAPATVEVLGRLSTLRTAINPAPIVPFVGVLPGRPILRPNPAEVERAFTVPLAELSDPEVYREELWQWPDGTERPMHFFELIGDTVWGATARMLYELLELVLAVGP
jgi:8-oxo-dGTP pyrophosphatase MutT (NUDIX family)